MANEAGAALADAYGHVMHGDDAGSSAKVVWVVHPTRVPVAADAAAAAAAGGGGGDASTTMAAGGGSGTGTGSSDHRHHHQQQQQQQHRGGREDAASGAMVSDVGGASPASSSYLFTQKFGELELFAFPPPPKPGSSPVGGENHVTLGFAYSVGSIFYPPLPGFGRVRIDNCIIIVPHQPTPPPFPPPISSTISHASLSVPVHEKIWD